MARLLHCACTKNAPTAQPCWRILTFQMLMMIYSWCVTSPGFEGFSSTCHWLSSSVPPSSQWLVYFLYPLQGSFKCVNKESNAYSPSYTKDFRETIIWNQEFKTSLGNIVRVGPKQQKLYGYSSSLPPWVSLYGRHFPFSGDGALSFSFLSM